ncbi:MAG: hypothetical protein LBQ90_06660, partial [Synergistaceae bacterium]|nr:hypothetical protein [Synergistaceae bacterium]
MRKIWQVWQVLQILLMIMAVVFLATGSSFAYDIGGRWLLKGGGHAEKGVVRVALQDSGYLNFLTEVDSGEQFLTSYSILVELDASRLDINAWRYAKMVTLPVPIKMPEVNPTLSQPFELPPVTADGLTWVVRFTSATSGTVDIYGEIDVDVVGRVTIDSQSAIWKEGTEEPDISDKLSGCNAGVPAAALFMSLLLPAMKGVR